MPNKKEIDKTLIDDYVERLNKGEIKKGQVIKELKISSRTWSTKVDEAGWKYNRSEFKYYKEGQPEEIIQGQIKMQNISAAESKNNKPVVKEIPINADAADQPEKNRPKPGRPQIQRDELLIKRTFLITASIDKALKLKAINENKGVNELVREIFINAIEQKYFKGL